MPDEILIDTETGTVVETVVAGALLDAKHTPGAETPEIGTVCSNCHTALKGRHCHHCGQIADTFHRPVWALFSEILEGYLGLDGRIWRTIPALLFKPGKITVQYLHGVRQPYMSPIRLFLLSSLLFFLTFALLTASKSLNGPQGLDIITVEGNASAIEAIAQARAELSGIQEKANTTSSPVPGLELAQASIDALDRELKRKQLSDTPEASRFTLKQRTLCELRSSALPEDPPSALCKEVQEETEVSDRKAGTKEDTPVVNIKLGGDETGTNTSASLNTTSFKTIFSLDTRRFLIENIETAVNNPEQYRASLSRWAPRLVFILAPAYGLILALSFFWRRDIYIYDHMVVALHFHAFLFLFLVLLVPIGLLAGAGYAVAIFALWSNYYLYRMLRRVYKSSRVGAVARAFVLDSVYLVLLTTAFMVLLVLGIVFV